MKEKPDTDLPAEGKRYLPRHELLRAALDMVEQGVVVIGAPCGYGKSWLARQIYTHLSSSGTRGSKALFVRVTAQSTCRQFTRDVISGMQRLGLWDDGSVRNQLEDIVSSLRDCDALPAIVIDMDGQPPSRPVRLLIANLVSALANQTPLVIACRRPEHLALRRLELLTSVGVIGAHLLGFTAQETAAARNLDKQAADRWCSIALGWPVACGDPWIGIDKSNANNGTENDVFAAVEDYIERDMLAGLGDQDAELLQKCSVLEKIEPGVYHALGLKAPWSRIVNIIESGIPTVSAGHFCDEIVIHPLVRRYLEKRLRAWTPRWHTEMHRAAADYHLSIGDTSRALAQVANIDDSEIIAEIADKAGGWRASLVDGFVPLGVANRCDETLIHRHPGAALAKIYWKTQLGRIQEASYELRQFCLSHADAVSSSDVAAIEAMLKIYDDQPVADSLMETLREREGGEFSSEPLLEPGCETLQAALLNNAGEREKAYAVATSSILLAERLGSPYVEFYGRWQQALALQGLGRVRQANDAYARLGLLADSLFGDSSNEARLVRLTSARTLILEGRVDEAREIADDLCELFQLHAWFDVYSHAMKATVALSEQCGDMVQREAVVSEFRAIASSRNITRLAIMIDLQEVRSNLRAGEIDKAQAYLSDANRRTSEIAGTWGKDHTTILPALKIEAARIKLQHGAFESACVLLDPVLAWAGDLDAEYRLESLLLGAYAAMGRRRLREVGEYMTIAAQLAAEYRLVEPMRDPINRAAQVVAFASNHAVPLDALVLRKLRRLVGSESDVSNHASPKQHYDEHEVGGLLTDRETDVVVLLAEGLSSKEIARHLDIGEGTVRTHRKHLYRKLGAKRRSQAIMKARELRLV